MPRAKRAAKEKPAPAAIQVLPPSEKPWLLTQDETTLIKNNVAKGASDEELKFLLTVARRYRLDPFKQQIWFVRRWDKNADDGRGGKGAHIWIAQVGINGLLFAAARDHKSDLGSIGKPEFGNMFTPTKGVSAPEWASVKVWKKGEEHPTEAEAWWSEYAPSDLSVAPFWRKMPRRMLAKCATALAIRQAYPDLGGLYIPEETERMNEDVTPSGRRILEPGKTEQIIPAKEVTAEDLQKYESITARPWREGRVALSGDSGLAIIKAEFSPEIIAELGIQRNAKEKVTHLPVANLFRFIDRAKVLNIEVHYAEPSSPPGEIAGETAAQGQQPSPAQVI